MPTPKQVHEAAVQSFEEARAGLPDALGRMTEANEKLKSGEITPEARAVWQEKFDRAYADFDAGTKRAAALKAASGSFGSLLETPVATHPQVEGAEPISLAGASAEAGRGGNPAAGAAAFGAELRPEERIILSGRARTLLNSILRGGRGGARRFESLSKDEREFLTSARKEMLMSPYVDQDGGLVTAEEIRNEVIRHQRDMTHIRARARVISTTASSIAFPTAKIDLTLAKTRAGIGNGQTPTVLSKVFGKIRFTPSGESRIVKVPEELIEDATFDVIGFLSEEIASNDRESEEEKFLIGTGSGEALGILTALARLTAAGFTNLIHDHSGTGAAFTPNDIKIFPYKLKAKYRQKAVWMSCRKFIENVSIMRDESGGAGTGQYLFKAGLEAGDSSKIVGYDFLESEFFPDKITSGADGDLLALFWDPSNYWIVDRKSLDLRVLPEIYTETDEVGYKYSKRFDAAPVRADSAVAMAHK